MKRNHSLLNADALNKPCNRIPDGILARWDKTIVAKEDVEVASIDIFDVIGSDFFGEGFTAKRMSAALRSIGDEKDVVVNINSPGGSVFEAATIYNLLVQHKGNVTINILGIAASAASVIAMAGDTIKISKIGFLMIHNAWSCVCGNKDDLREYADVLEKLDDSIISSYAARASIDAKKIAKLMDEETYISADEAMEYGLADEIIDVKKAAPKQPDEKQAKAQARRTIEMALAKEGFSRKEREDIFQRAGTRDASDPAAREAGDWTQEKGWEDLINVMTN